jgi:hypothetical protein
MKKKGKKKAPRENDPDKAERNWRYPWEKAWREGLRVKWQ